MVTWFKDGTPLEDRSVGTRTSEVDTILFVRSAERGHSGTYTLSVQIENMLDSADIRIQVVGQSHGGVRGALGELPPRKRTTARVTDVFILKLDDNP